MEELTKLRMDVAEVVGIAAGTIRSAHSIGLSNQELLARMHQIHHKLSLAMDKQEWIAMLDQLILADKQEWGARLTDEG